MVLGDEETVDDVSIALEQPNHEWFGIPEVGWECRKCGVVLLITGDHPLDSRAGEPCTEKKS
jgi:hypothetical protein